MGKTPSKLPPAAIADLLDTTHFKEQEIKKWYKDFLSDFPTGKLTIEQFQDVYSQHFPDGDATNFAAHVFRTFDKDSNHLLDFREFMCALSVTARGGAKERLQWAFLMYDIDENGYITREETTEIIKAMYKLVGSKMSAETSSMTPNQRSDFIFSKLDANNDGKITLQEFIDGASSDPALEKMLTRRY